MSSYKSIDEIIQAQIKKIGEIQNAVKLLKAAKSDVQVHAEIKEKYEKIQSIRLKMEKLKEALNYQKKLCEDLKKSSTILHSLTSDIEKIHAYSIHNNIQNKEEDSNESKSTSYEYSPFEEPTANHNAIQMKPIIKPVILKTELLEIVALSEAELADLPKYMVGRLNLETINRFGDIFNQAIRSKYNLLQKSRLTLNPKDKSLYENYKRDETRETKGKYFITGPDIAKLQGLKNLEKRSFTILNILRHAKRITEFRSGGVVRYMLI